MKLEYPHEGNAEIYMKVMTSICGDITGKTMLDVCCGEIPHTDKLAFAEKTFVDVEDRGFASRYPNFIRQDIFEFFKTNKKIYDVCICSDAIEHFRRNDAHELLHQMDLCSDKQIIFTPLGAHMVEQVASNDPHTHKTGFYPHDFEGWATISFPNFHAVIGIGAFFAWTSLNLDEEFERVKNELNEIL